MIFWNRYLCLHDGGLLDTVVLGKNLEVKKLTAQNYIARLEAAHLIHRLPPHRHGKLLKIPSPLACYWLGQSEIRDMRRQDHEE